MPLGSGALAGSPFSIDRLYLSDLLGFDNITPNSLLAVGDRDFVGTHYTYWLILQSLYSEKYIYNNTIYIYYFVYIQSNFFLGRQFWVLILVDWPKICKISNFLKKILISNLLKVLKYSFDLCRIIYSTKEFNFVTIGKSYGDWIIILK
jgi:hypothetical protein